MEGHEDRLEDIRRTSENSETINTIPEKGKEYYKLYCIFFYFENVASSLVFNFLHSDIFLFKCGHKI